MTRTFSIISVGLLVLLAAAGCTENQGVNAATGQVHVEINGLAAPQSPEATRICREDLNEVVTSFLQDKVALERGLFDFEEAL